MYLSSPGHVHVLCNTVGLLGALYKYFDVDLLKQQVRHRPAMNLLLQCILDASVWPHGRHVVVFLPNPISIERCVARIRLSTAVFSSRQNVEINKINTQLRRLVYRNVSF